jgi:hypothetical protein
LGDKQKKKRRRQTCSVRVDGKCMNCGELFKWNETGHFVPPGMGDPGFFICEKKEEKK